MGLPLQTQKIIVNVNKVSISEDYMMIIYFCRVVKISNGVMSFRCESRVDEVLCDSVFVELVTHSLSDHGCSYGK